MATQPMDEFWWADPALKQRLVSDPVGVLKERGINVDGNFPLAAIHDLIRLTSLIWKDGRIVRADQFLIDPFDEGLLFGRGVWESTRTFGGHPWLWPIHLDRLKQTATLLGFEVAPERLPDAAAVTQFVRILTAQDVVIRLNVSAGRQGKPGTVWMSCSLMPAPIESYKLATGQNPVSMPSPYLIGKTFHYASRMFGAKPAWQNGFDSVLWYDANHNLLESAHANIFLRMPEGWVTPSVESGLFLPGTVRHQLLKNPVLPIKEAVIPVSRIAEAQEVFVTNSNVGIVPVVLIDKQSYPIGPETAQLKDWLMPKKVPVK
ncbi:MAG: aminotransferase class IV [Gemmataceae bacterium]